MFQHDFSTGAENSLLIICWWAGKGSVLIKSLIQFSLVLHHIFSDVTIQTQLLNLAISSDDQIVF